MNDIIFYIIAIVILTLNFAGSLFILFKVRKLEDKINNLGMIVSQIHEFDFRYGIRFCGEH